MVTKVTLGIRIVRSFNVTCMDKAWTVHATFFLALVGTHDFMNVLFVVPTFKMVLL